MAKYPLARFSNRLGEETMARRGAATATGVGGGAAGPDDVSQFLQMVTPDYASYQEKTKQVFNLCMTAAIDAALVEDKGTVRMKNGCWALCPNPTPLPASPAAPLSIETTRSTSWTSRCAASSSRTTFAETRRRTLRFCARLVYVFIVSCWRLAERPSSAPKAGRP